MKSLNTYSLLKVNILPKIKSFFCDFCGKHFNYPPRYCSSCGKYYCSKCGTDYYLCKSCQIKEKLRFAANSEQQKSLQPFLVGGETK